MNLINNNFNLFLSVFYWELKKDLKKQLLYLFLLGSLILLIILYTLNNILPLTDNYKTSNIKEIFFSSQLLFIWIQNFFFIFITVDSFLFQKYYTNYLNLYFNNNYLIIFTAKICSYSVKLIIFLTVLYLIHYNLYTSLILKNLNLMSEQIFIIKSYYFINYILLIFFINFINFINFLFNILFINNIYKNKLLMILQLPVLLSITFTNVMLFVKYFPTVDKLKIENFLSLNEYFIVINNGYIIPLFLSLIILFLITYFSILNKIFIHIIKK